MQIVSNFKEITHLKPLKNIFLYEEVLDLKKNKEYEIIDFFAKTGFVDVENEQKVIVTISTKDKNFKFFNKYKNTLQKFQQ